MDPEIHSAVNRDVAPSSFPETSSEEVNKPEEKDTQNVKDEDTSSSTGEEESTSSDATTNAVASYRFSTCPDACPSPDSAGSGACFKKWEEVESAAALHLYSRTVKMWTIYAERMSEMERSDHKFIKNLDEFQEKFRQLIVQIKKNQF